MREYRHRPHVDPPGAHEPEVHVGQRRVGEWLQDLPCGGAPQAQAAVRAGDVVDEYLPAGRVLADPGRVPYAAGGAGDHAEMRLAEPGDGQVGLDPGPVVE